MREYLPLLEEELAVGGEDRRAPGWASPTSRADIDVSGGDHRRRHVRPARRPPAPAGRGAFIVLEKNADVGGTWYENTYPGCRVDNPNHNYSYSFAQRHDWPFHYSTQDVLLRVLPRLRRRVRPARAHPVRHRGRVGRRGPTTTAAGPSAYRSADGDDDGSTANAVDQRRRAAQPAALPDIDGIETFAGRPSTRRAGTTTSTSPASGWRSSAPAPAPCSSSPRSPTEVGELAVFQRTPPWLGPTPDYHDAGRARVCAGSIGHVPLVQRVEPVLDLLDDGRRRDRRVTVDPDWDRTDTRSARCDEIAAQLLTAVPRGAVRRPPRPARQGDADVPAGRKRMLRDNGVWAGALTRDNVATGHRPRIREINAEGHRHRRRPPARRRRHHLRHRVPGVEVPHADDGHRPRRRRPPRALGRRRPRLPRRHRSRASRTCSASTGRTPTSSSTAASSTSPSAGCATSSAASRLLLEHGGHALEVRQDVHDAFNERVDAREPQMAWGVSTVNSWYKKPPAASPRTGRSPSSSTGSAPANPTPPTTSSSTTRPRPPHTSPPGPSPPSPDDPSDHAA